MGAVDEIWPAEIGASSGLGSMMQRHADRPGCAKIDVHCHSTLSDEYWSKFPAFRMHPTLTPAELYARAKSRGMTFVTITDHDTIDGCKAFLDERGPTADFVVGEEVSTRFPSDGMVVHVNVYDHNEAEHREIHRLAGNIHELIPYLRSIGKLFVLNHPTWNKHHQPILPQRVEEFLELFDVFEGVNGTRTHGHNSPVWSMLERHRGKVMVAGSDSHTDNVGTTYTEIDAQAAPPTWPALASAIRAGRTVLRGQMGSPAKTVDDMYKFVAFNLQQRLAASHWAINRAGWRVFARVGTLGGAVGIRLYYRRQRSLLRTLQPTLPTA